jgi:hypothetical protein
MSRNAQELIFLIIYSSILSVDIPVAILRFSLGDDPVMTQAW